LPTVSAAPENENRHEGATNTLGELLYRDTGKTHALEREWVELMRSIAAGDQLALRGLYERSHRLVYTLTMRITGNRQTAEELTLDVFHDVWRRASTYDAEGGPVLGWIMNQARSRAIDRLRYEGRKKRVDPQLSDPDSITAAEESQEAIEGRDHGRRLQAALSVLTPEERQAIETAYFSELTYAETAARLNQPLGTIKTRIRSGLEKLRNVLRAEVSI
jgi:RNA polymerase sigma-70 factor, ECF subfamily